MSTSGAPALDQPAGPFSLLLAHTHDGDVIVLSLDHAAADGMSALRLLGSIARAYAREDDPLPPIDPLKVRDVGVLTTTARSRSTRRLQFHIFGALAQFEREVIRERIRAGLTAAPRVGALSLIHLRRPSPGREGCGRADRTAPRWCPLGHRGDHPRVVGGLAEGACSGGRQGSARESAVGMLAGDV